MALRLTKKPDKKAAPTPDEQIVEAIDDLKTVAAEYTDAWCRMVDAHKRMWRIHNAGK